MSHWHTSQLCSPFVIALFCISLDRLCAGLQRSLSLDWVPKPEFFVIIPPQFNCELLQCGRINNMSLRKHGFTHHIRIPKLFHSFPSHKLLPFTFFFFVIYFLSSEELWTEKPFEFPTKVKSPKFAIHHAKRLQGIQSKGKKNKQKKKKSKISKQSFHAYQQAPVCTRTINIFAEITARLRSIDCTRLVFCFDTLTITVSIYYYYHE